MAAARLRVVDVARDGEHLSPDLGRQAGGDQRAGLQRGLHHQRAGALGGDQPVALRKVARQRSGAQRVFAQQQAMLGQAPRQRQMGARVDAVQPGAHEGDAAAGAVQRALVRRTVDALGQARHHGDALAAQRGGKAAGIQQALRRGVTAADHGHRRTLQQVEPAERVHQQRRVTEMQPGGGIVGIAQRQQAVLGRFVPPALRALDQRGQALGHRRECIGHRPAHHCRHGATPRRQHRLRAAKSRQQTPRAQPADARRLQQPQPRGEFIGQHGQAGRR